MRGGTDEKKQHRLPGKRREKITEVAAKHFIEKGYAGTSLSDIVRETGGSRRDIYDFFGGKRELFDAVLKTLMSDILDVSEMPEPEGDGTSVRHDLICMGHGFLNAILNPVFVSTMRQFIPLAPDRQELGVGTYLAGPTVFHQRLERYLRQQVRNGVLELNDPSTSARILSGMLKGDFQIRALLIADHHIDEGELENHVADAVDTFLYGVRPSVERRANPSVRKTC